MLKNQKTKKIIDLKWIYTKKTNNNYKARLVVRGYQQRDIIDEIYSPVAKMQTLKILLSHCCQNNLFIEQMDVETAFLNGKVKSEIYVKQPEGYDDGSENVFKLKKALYGLRESPRAWYECFDNYLLSLNFVRSKTDYCLYRLSEEVDIYLILFVDDLLICCKDKNRLIHVKKLLQDRLFKMKDLGVIKTYLGIHVDYDYKEGILTLDQTNYIDSIAIKYNLENSKLYETPMEQNLKLVPAKSICDHIKYRNLIGILLYISSATRPDISFSVNYLSRFQNCFDNTHYNYALRILKYLYLTKDLKLILRKNVNHDIIDCFVDADWAGDVVDRKSTTGYVIRMYGNVIYWKSKKQSSVTKSSTSAEYVALSECVSELIIIKDVIKDLGINLCKPIKIYEDNSGTISIAKYGNFTKKSKYIETHYYFVNENFEKGEIDKKKNRF